MAASTKWYAIMLVGLGLAEIARAGEGPPIDPIWLAKAETEVKSILERYQALCKSLEEVSEIRYDKAPGPAGKMPFKPQTRRARVVRLGNEMIAEQTRFYDDDPKRPRIRLECDNSDYFFTLGKSKESDGFLLEDYAAGKRKLGLIDQGRGEHSTMFGYLESAIAAIRKEPRYTLQGLRFDDKRGLLRIDMTMGTIQSEERIYADPAHDWRVVERRVETPSLVATDTFTYGLTVGGLTFPTECKNLTNYKVPEAPPNMSITTRLISLKVTDKVPADFRMSAFGLPEPMGMPPVNRGGTRWWLWITLASVGTLVSAVLFLRLKRYFQIPAPVKP